MFAVCSHKQVSDETVQADPSLKPWPFGVAESQKQATRGRKEKNRAPFEELDLTELVSFV